MKFSVGVFVGLLHALDVCHNIQSPQQVDIHSGGIAHKAKNGMRFAFGGMYADIHAFQPTHQIFQLFLIRVFLQNNDHDSASSKIAFQ